LGQAKRIYPEVAARVDARFAQADGAPAHLTQKQTVALAGQWYSTELAAYEDEAGDEEGWGLALGALSDAYEAGKLTKAVEADVVALLQGEGLLLDDASRQQLSERVFWNKVRLFNTLAKRSHGDYSPDSYLETFPQFVRPTQRAERQQGTARVALPTRHFSTSGLQRVSRGLAPSTSGDGSSNASKITRAQMTRRASLRQRWSHSRTLCWARE